jgi:type IV secretory pathway TraG/TraD family ATPase VirD4
VGLFDDNLSGRARDLDQDGTPDTGAEYLLWAALGIALLVSSLWIAFWVSALLAFDLLPLTAVISLPSGIAGALAHPFDVSHGWGEYKGKIGPWWLFWPTLVFTLIYVSKLVRSIYKRYVKWRFPDRGGAKWATDEDLVEIIDPKKSLFARMLRREKKATGVVFGEKEDTKRLVRLQKDNHALVVAGTRSGKTAGLMTPALLTYKGAVIATSVKDDLVKDTLPERKKEGRVWIFDPARALIPRTGDPEVDKANGAVIDPEDIAYWSPLDNARERRDAMRMAEVLITTTMNQSGDSGNMQFFKNMAQKVLPVLLYAAAVMDEDMRRVIRWMNRINDKTTHAEVDSVLRWKNNVEALDIWLGFLKRDQKLRGDIGATIESTLVVYQDPWVQESAKTQVAPPGRHINSKDFLDGGKNTLYVVAPMSEQSRLEPIFVALMQGMLTDISDLPQNLKTPMLVALDEAANIAGMPKLPEFLSTIGSKGVSIITAWQDFSQIEAKYGKSKNTVLNNSRGKLILPGVTDPETLKYFSDIGGQEIVEQYSVGRQERDYSSRNVNVSEREKPLLDTTTLREQKFGHGILVYGNLPAVRIRLKMFFLDQELRVKAGLPPANPIKLQLRKLPVVGKLVKV